MQWTKEQLQELADEFVVKYFNSEIKYPIEVKLDRSYYVDNLTWASARFKNHKVHIIKVNVSLLNADYDIVESKLVHELVHCLQDEKDKTWPKTFDKDGGHNAYFNKICKKLNDKYHFKYPLQRYVSDEEIEKLDNTQNAMYYVYTIEYYNSFNPKMAYGFFIKHLYDVEINLLRKKGFKVKYYDNVIKKSDGSIVKLDGTNTVKYSWLKPLNPKDDMSISDQAIVHGIEDFIYAGYWFNFDDGKVIAESEVTDALNILSESGYLAI